MTRNELSLYTTYVHLLDLVKRQDGPLRPPVQPPPPRRLTDADHVSCLQRPARGGGGGGGWMGRMGVVPDGENGCEACLLLCARLKDNVAKVLHGDLAGGVHIAKVDDFL